MSKAQTKPKSSGGKSEQKKNLLPKSKWVVVLVNSTAEKILEQFLDEEGQIDTSKVTQNEKYDKRQARDFRNRLEDYQELYEDYQNAITDSQKDSIKSDLFSVFDKMVTQAKDYYRSHSEVAPFIMDEWRYTTLEAQKADLASLETQREERIAWLESCPFTLTQRAKDEIVKIDSDHIGRH